MSKTERRYHYLAELRVEGDEAHPILVGNAIVYDTLSEDLGYFREKIAPGAFTESLKTADVRCLIDHDPSLLLGRNLSKTLRMTDSTLALKIECDLDSTSYALDLAKTVRRGDRDGMSFGFIAEEDHWDEDKNGVIRTVTKAKLFDVSAVTYPAYTATSLGLRSLAEDTTEALRSLEAWRLAAKIARPIADEIRRLKLRCNQSFLHP